MIDTTVLYHRGCMDGYGAALATWMKLGDNAQYLGVQYGEPAPVLPENHALYIVDFSFPYLLMLQYLERHPQVVFLDHHLGSRDDAEILFQENHSNLVCRHDQSECGATLTWEYCFPEQHRPLLFDYLRDFDLWLWELPQSREAAASLATQPRTFENWLRLLQMGNAGILELQTEGQGIRRADMHHINAMLSTSLRMARIDKYDVPVVNAPILFSEAAHEAMIRTPGALFGAYYCPLKDGRIKWGLRGENKVDLNAIAKHYGGGGHFNAASFIAEPRTIQFHEV